MQVRDSDSDSVDRIILLHDVAMLASVYTWSPLLMPRHVDTAVLYDAATLTECAVGLNVSRQSRHVSAMQQQQQQLGTGRN